MRSGSRVRPWTASCSSPGVAVVDAAALPDALALLRQHVCVVLDLSGFDAPSRSAAVSQVSEALEAARALHAVPQWVVVDEAHSVVPADVWEQGAWAARGLCLATCRPDLLPPEVLARADVTIATVLPAGATDLDGSRSRVRGLLQEGSAQRSFTVADRRSAHVRHRRKHADVDLPPQRWFHLRTAEGATGATEHNLTDLVRHLRTSPPAVAPAPRAARRLLAVIRRRVAGQPARRAAAAEREVADRRQVVARDARRRMVEAVEHRYGTEAGTRCS